MDDKLTLAPTTTQQALVLEVTGDLDHETAARTLLDAGAALPPPPLIVLDPRKLGLLTAAGMHMLEAFSEASRVRGVRVHLLYTPNTSVARVLEMAQTRTPVYVELVPALAEDPGGVYPDVLLAQLESLTHNLLDTTTVGATLQRIVDAAQVIVVGADLVSVTLRGPNGTLYTPAQTEGIGSVLDQAQYETEQGPCYDAADPAGPAYAASDDLTTETRWPHFAAAATRHGYRAIQSTELHPAAGANRLSGALNIYSRQPGAFTEADRHAALLLATHASLALAHTHATEMADLSQTSLRHAIDTRDIIGQAKGILMTRQNITADEAFDLLRRPSQDLNVKLVDLARTVTTHHRELDEP